MKNCTIVQNNQEPRSKHWATRMLHCAHLFTRWLTHSLPNLWENEWLNDFFAMFFFLLDYSALRSQPNKIVTLQTMSNARLGIVQRLNEDVTNFAHEVREAVKRVCLGWAAPFWSKQIKENKYCYCYCFVTNLLKSSQPRMNGRTDERTRLSKCRAGQDDGKNKVSLTSTSSAVFYQPWIAVFLWIVNGGTYRRTDGRHTGAFKNTHPGPDRWRKCSKWVRWFHSCPERSFGRGWAWRKERGSAPRLPNGLPDRRGGDGSPANYCTYGKKEWIDSVRRSKISFFRNVW